LIGLFTAAGRPRRTSSVGFGLVMAGVLLAVPVATASPAPSARVGTYSGKTSQHKRFTMFVVDSPCPGSASPVRLCLYASGPNNVELLVDTTCKGGASGSTYGVELGPSVIPRNGVVKQRQGLAPGTFTSHIVLKGNGTASGYFIASAKGCSSGKVTFAAHRTGPIKD